MDAYPKEFIDGVTPLIFAIDAVFTEERSNERGSGGVSMNSNSRSTAFETFYEYIASRRTDHSLKNPVKSASESDPLSKGQQSASSALPSIASLRSSATAFRISKSITNTGATTTSGDAHKHNSDFFSHARVVPVSHRHAFPPSKDPHGNNNSVTKLNNALYAARKLRTRVPYQLNGSNSNSNNTTPQNHQHPNQNQSFPSTPSTAILPNAESNQNYPIPPPPTPLTTILGQNPILGILPEGWIEKHTHALPSTLLFITTLDLSNTPYQQAQLEQFLQKTIENITTSGAKKRESPVHLVCLVKVDGTSGVLTPKESAMESERLGGIRNICRLGTNCITALHYFEQSTLDTGVSAPVTASTGEPSPPTGPNKASTRTVFIHHDFSKLQSAVKSESTLYYLTQVRRCKRKHALLHHHKFMDLLPYAARYCIKIAIFYEFQGWSDPERSKKSAKYWSEAYRNVMVYYQCLQGRGDGSRIADSSGKDGKAYGGRGGKDLGRLASGSGVGGIGYTGRSLMDAETDSQVTGVTIGSSTLGEEESVETAFAGAGDGSLSPSIPPPPSMDGTVPSSPSQQSTTATGDAGVEVALLYSPGNTSGKLAINARTPISAKTGIPDVHDMMDGGDLKSGQEQIMTHSEDMIHQCRAVAELLNIKLLLTDYAAALRSLSDPNANNTNSGQDIGTMLMADPNEITFAHLAKQIRTHTQVFMSTPPSLCLTKPDSNANSSMHDPVWFFMAYVARQRLVISEFLQRYPIPSNHQISFGLDIETPIYCDAVHHYVSCGESFLRLGTSVRKKVEKDECQGNNGQKPNTLDGKHDNRQRFVGCLGSHDLEEAWEEESKRDHHSLALEYLNRGISMSKADGKDSNSSMRFVRAHYLTAGILMKRGEYKLAIEKLKLVLDMVRGFPSLRMAAEVAMTKCLQKCEEERNTDACAATLFDCRTNSILSQGEISSLQKAIIAGSVPNISFPSDAESSQPIHYSFTFTKCSYATEGDVVDGLLHIYSCLPFAVKLEHVKLDMNVGSVTFENIEKSTILPKQYIQVPAKLVIPSGCMRDIDVKVLDKQSVKKSRRNTCGLTKIGGGVYKHDVHYKLSGGLCVTCLGAEFTLASTNSNDVLAVISIQNRHRGSFPLQGLHGDETGKKRASLEEDNFVYSAWSRPDYFAMRLGPRCLRVLRTQSQLSIQDLTTPLVNGRAMEGTVNRFMFHLKSGSTEQCKNIQMRVTCSSWVDTEEASNQRVSADNESAEKQNSDKFPRRIPILVTPSPSPHASNGFGLPGWKPVEGKQDEETVEWIDISDNLDSGSEMITHFDIYRPLLCGDQKEEEDEKDFQCKTRFTVDIAYKQVRLDQVNHYQCQESVIQTYRGTIIWSSPFEAKFGVLSRKERSTPSGSRHPSNYLGSNSIGIDNKAVISGSVVAVTCSLQSPEAANNLAAEVGQVHFENDAMDEDEDCEVELVNQKYDDSSPTLLYSPKPDDFCNQLTSGSRLKLSYSVRPKLKQPIISDADSAQVSSTHLGGVSIEFMPLPLQINEEMEQLMQEDDKFLGHHGPLPIKNLPPFKLKGPIFYVEATPFDASFLTFPSMPRVAAPFEVMYNIKNKTALQQRLKVSMLETEGTTNGMLVSGVINGELILGPMESKMLRYSILVTKIGKTVLPRFNVSSLRYNTWVIRSSTQDSIYVLP